ncbi:flagellar protein [Anaeromicropila populeti]|uniref:Flagellar operon protein TIGR03826 n=1 Tax=Anaeromicropila populeti TaxID=37658 RepID=A0A1I6J301_9FIRM|nr:flagellar protein [Anaeromicropila populeti]SFR73309.1 flagellar operon protein TIGR03826 [Anaeromicropila populeti]
MEVRNCKMCGRLFNYMGGAPICPKCENALEEKYQEVKAYVYDNPNAGIQEVAEENDVTVNQIKKWIRDERLSFSDDSPIGIACEKCGAMIKTGRFCKDCKNKMASGLENLYAKPKIEGTLKKNTGVNHKMRFLDHE